MAKKRWMLGVLLPLLLVGCSAPSGGASSSSSSFSSSQESSEESSAAQSSSSVESSSSATQSSSAEQSSSSGTESSSSATQSSSAEQSSSSSEEQSSSSSEESSSSATQSSSEEQSSSAGPIHVKSVSLDQKSIVFYEDDPPVTLTATVLPEAADNKEVAWSSSNTNVAIVSEGTVTPVNPGDATITVKTVDGNKTATCKVSVAFPNYVVHGKFKDQSDWIDMPMAYNEYSTNEYMLLGVQLYKDDVFSIHMYGDTWYGFSDLKSSIASGLFTKASTNNDIKVLTTGVYDIYSSYNESDGGHIYLGESSHKPSPGTVPVSDVILNRSGKYLQFRHEYQLTATVYPSYATNPQVVWTSSDESVATVTKAGRVVAKSKTGTTVITATTVDQQKVDTCLIYVSSYETPEYFLTGTIGGRSYSYGSYTYAALPLGSGQYLIPNVNLIKGDEITVTLRNGSRLKCLEKIGYPVYTYPVTENKSVNMYLDTRKNDDYLSAVNRASRDVYVKYDSDTNDDGRCGWLYVQGSDITPQWIKSNDLRSKSTGSRFNIPKHATGITFARAYKDQTPDNYFSSLEGMTRVRNFEVIDGVYEYDACVDSD